MTRKRWLVLLVGFGVTVAGVSLWWWQQSRPADVANPSPSAFFSHPTSPTPTPAQPLTACRLVPKSELETIVGEVLIDPKESPVVNRSGVQQQSCLYLAASGNFTPVVQITFIQSNPDDPESLIRYWLQTKTAQSTYARFEPINRFGQDAYFGSVSVYALEEGGVVSATVSLRDSTGNRAAMEKVVEAALVSLRERVTQP